MEKNKVKPGRGEVWKAALGDGKAGGPRAREVGSRRSAQGKFVYSARKPPDSSPRRQKASPGAYVKSPEEYNEEIQDLRKTTANLKNENETLKAKLRRLEDDSNKKKKTLENLLDPTKNEQAFSPRNTDAALTIHNLKQKIFRLETQLKEKETTNLELRSQSKITKFEEMKTQLETLYIEVLRLRNESDEKPPSRQQQQAPPPPAGGYADLNENSRADSLKQEALMTALKRLNEDNKQLREQVNTLTSQLESTKQPAPMAKRLSISSEKSVRRDSKQLSEPDQNKLKEQLQSSENKEKELNEKINSLKQELAKKGKENNLLKKMFEEKCSEVEQLKKTSSSNQATPSSAAATSKSKAPVTVTEKPPPPTTKTIEKKSLPENKTLPPGVEEFRRNHAAKTIQSSWKKYKIKNENNAFIQSAIKGFLIRERSLQQTQSGGGSTTQLQSTAVGK